MSELVEDPRCVRDGHAPAKWYPVVGWTCERCGLAVPEPFYAPGYQYEVAVAGATDLLTSKINALPLLLAVAKAAARSTATPDAPGAQAAIDAAVVALYDQHPGWREWQT